MNGPIVRADWEQALNGVRTLERRGRVVDAFGTLIRVRGIDARIGQQCVLVDHVLGVRVPAEVVGLSEGLAILTPLASLRGIPADAEVLVVEDRVSVPFGNLLLGRVLNAHGEPVDGGPALPAGMPCRDVFGTAPDPLTRKPIASVFETGVKAIDSLLTIGLGQRVGVFAMAGGGKSTLLGMLARNAQSDVNVIALIGERGREVREFIDDALGTAGLKRSVVVVSTSDRPAMERVRAAHVATAIAEGFRAQGASVLLLMDSVTRFARALREIGLSVGEPAVRRGFPPSVFSELPCLFERAGNDSNGSITAFYTVLTEDDDGSDPIGEEVRSILDGHIYLSRKLAQANHYPAIDVLSSVSRVFPRVAKPDQKLQAGQLRAWMAKYAEIEFMLQIGEYKPGGDPVADRAVERMPAIRDFLIQDADERRSISEALTLLDGIAQ
jgi:ATP synthase in type III secretion protein N